MKFSYNWLQSLIKQKLPEPEKLVELLTMHSFEIEKGIKEKNDFILDIAVLPNRGHDCFSYLGMVREIATLMGVKYEGKKTDIKEDIGIRAKDFVSVDIQDKDCRRYTAGVMTDIKVGQSPDWLKERLMACGLRPINNIVDIANYVMLETGQPLHAFDAQKIADKKIIVRKAKKSEKIETLDDETLNLDPDILLIADSSGPLAVAGIKGGKKSGISQGTKTIIIESANFEPMAIRKGSKKLKLKTDASWRFEHDLDANLTEMAIKRIMALIQETAGGKIAQGLVDVFLIKPQPKKIKLRLDMVKEMLGIDISEKDIKGILDKLGFEIIDVEKEKGLIEVVVPTIRGDITIVEDLIEEIGRVWGFNNIPSVLPQVALSSPRQKDQAYWEEMAKNTLKDLGFWESYNRSFVGSQEIELFNIPIGSLIEVANPPSGDYQYLRPDFLIHLLENLSLNQKLVAQLKLFELGKIFDNSEGERRLLIGAAIGYDFYDIKGALEKLLSIFHNENIGFINVKNPDHCWDNKEISEIKIGKESIGYLGKVNQSVLGALKINQDVFAFKINFEKLETLAKKNKDYVPVSAYPPATRDLAILVPIQVSTIEVIGQIKASEKLLKDIEVFDVYSGKNIPQGKKNIAFHLVYQPYDHTLKTEEIDQIHKNIINALEKNPGWQVRK